MSEATKTTSPSAPSAPSTPSATTTPKQATSNTIIQNGKGDAPRNISQKFRRNYDSINWGHKR